jgi:hypothetical protein
MFSTWLYLFLLFFDGFFSKSAEEYNIQISHLNQQISQGHFIFTNPEIEQVIAVLELKTNPRHYKTSQVILQNHTIENDILYSYFLAKKGNTKEGLADLHRSIIKNGNVDTLVKAYELYAINFPQNKLKKQANSAQMISQSQKINTQEALSLLDLMKKKQKNLIY